MARALKKSPSEASEYRATPAIMSASTAPRKKAQNLCHPIAQNMPYKIQSPCKSVIEVIPLTQHSFSNFGVVIENPNPTIEPSAALKRLPSRAVRANQGTALKYIDVTDLLDLYGSAPSRICSRAVMNMFVCAPRALRGTRRNGIEDIFRVDILERHPFTTQTFIPLGISGLEEQNNAHYLVIVAPSLPPSHEDEGLPVPSHSPPGVHLPGRGLPDLTKVQAFLAQGCQAVTYGAGTWHAPMVVIGEKSVDFVVVQYANGVDIEDCQEILIQSSGQEHIEVAVAAVGKGRTNGTPKL